MPARERRRGALVAAASAEAVRVHERRRTALVAQEKGARKSRRVAETQVCAWSMRTARDAASATASCS